LGEAKVKRERLRATLLDECDRWSAPPSADEDAAREAVAALPVVKVRRLPADQIAYMRMPGRECHANCAWYAENDPERKTEHVIGWWIQPGADVLHSVIKRDGGYFCLTPQLAGTPEVFDFVPDPEIEAREEGEYRAFYRNGFRCVPGIRFDPAETIRYMEWMREKLLAGVNPMKLATMRM
jgi:hypothetical protein